MRKPILILAAGLTFLGGCKFVQELMHMSPPEVVSYSPDRERIEAAEVSDVRLTFSQDMNRTATEEAFSLGEEEKNLAGRYRWKGRTLYFTPFSGFKENKTYLAVLTTEAEDLFGNCLAEQFHFSFFTGTEKNRPAIAGHSPADGANPSNLFEPITITFSEPVDPSSLYTAFQLSPQVQGSFSWNADNSAVTFTPLEEYEAGEEYNVKITRELEDLSGNHLAEEHSFRFKAGTAVDIEIVSVEVVDSGITIEAVEVLSVNSGIEKDEELLITFTAPVPYEQRSSIVSLSPSVPAELAWSVTGDSCTVRFEEYLAYNQVYELEVLESTYRIRINGPQSLPPEVVRLTYKRDGSTAFVELHLNDSISITESADACFDFYIHHAAGAAIDSGAFLQAFAFESNALKLTFTGIVNPANGADPPPDPAPAGPDITVVRIAGFLEEQQSTGIVTVKLDTELKDSYDNSPAADYEMQVNYP